MSALGIATGKKAVTGTGAGTTVPAASPPGTGFFLGGLSALSRWLPTEIVTGYAAAVQVMQPAQKDGAPPVAPSISVAAWIICLIGTPLFVLLSVWLMGRWEHAGWKIGLSAPAFVLWSASVPEGAWNKLPAFAGNSAAFLLALFLVASAFTAVAEKLSPSTSS